MSELPLESIVWYHKTFEENLVSNQKELLICYYVSLKYRVTYITKVAKVS